MKTNIEIKKNPSLYPRFLQTLSKYSEVKFGAVGSSLEFGTPRLEEGILKYFECLWRGATASHPHMWGERNFGRPSTESDKLLPQMKMSRRLSGANELPPTAVWVPYKIHWKRKWSHFDLKSWATDEIKIRSVIPSDWRIFESNWLLVSSQFDSNILQLLGITDRILDPPVTQLFRSKWLHFFFQYCATGVFNNTQKVRSGMIASDSIKRRSN